MEEKFQAKKILLTNSCTAALEMAAILCDVGPGDEVILPSFTFVSTANAFYLRGAELIFVDIQEDVNCITVDKEGVLKTAAALNVDGVVTFASDVAMPTVGYVTAQLVLAGPGRSVPLPRNTNEIS